jgi:virginiamycin B lyase
LIGKELPMARTLTVLIVMLAAIAVPVNAEEDVLDELIMEADFARYGNGQFFGFGFDALWMMSGPKLVRINASDNFVSETLIKGATGQIRRVAFGEDAVWLADAGSQRIYKVDPDSGTVLLDFYVDIYGHIESTIAIGNGSVWIVTVNDRLLERFDVATGESQASIPLPSAASAVVFEYGAAWVIASRESELYRIEPETNLITDTIAVRPVPRTMTAGEGSVWVQSEPGAVQRVDPASRRVIASVDTKLDGWGDIGVGGGYVWFSLPGVFVQIDPQTNSIVRMMNGLGTGLAQEGHSIRYGGGSLWVGGIPLRRVRPPS